MARTPLLMVMFAWGYFYFLAGLALLILPEYTVVLAVLQRVPGGSERAVGSDGRGDRCGQWAVRSDLGPCHPPAPDSDRRGGTDAVLPVCWA